MNSRLLEKLSEFLPELVAYALEPDSDEYLLFSKCKHLATFAFKENDEDLWRRIFAFAEWSFYQEEKEIWNPAGVSFYEYIFDCESMEAKAAKAIPSEIYKEIRNLFESKYSAQRMGRIDSYYACDDRE
jgi:hypothetical protein